jgi:ABC-type nickel/cobalt efflux system permease component RcnA
MNYFRVLLISVIMAAIGADFCVTVDEAAAARNPFISSQKNEQPPPKSPMAGYPAFLQPLMEKLAVIQHTIKKQMVQRAKDIKQDPLGLSFWGFMLLAFSYGVVHALGPGHGKIYTCSYFLSRSGTVKKVLLFGNLTMFMHVLSGASLILFGAFVLKTSGAMTLENSGIVLERFSYGLLTVVGIFISSKIIYEFKKGHHHSHGSPDRADMKSLVLTAFAVGIVPCPGAALILLFSLTLGIFIAGLWAMLFIALGMAITSSMFAIGAVLFKKAFLSIADGNDRLAAGVYIVISLGGATCIALLGLLLLIGSF